MRFKQDKVAISPLALCTIGYVTVKTHNGYADVPVQDVKFDHAGRLVGSVIAYDKRRLYQVDFGSYTAWFNIKDCKVVTEAPDKPAVESAHTSIACHAWLDGSIVKCYLYPRKTRKLNVTEYGARVVVNGKSKWYVCRQDAENRLYLISK